MVDKSYRPRRNGDHMDPETCLSCESICMRQKQGIRKQYKQYISKMGNQLRCIMDAAFKHDLYEKQFWTIGSAEKDQGNGRSSLTSLNVTKNNYHHHF